VGDAIDGISWAGVFVANGPAGGRERSARGPASIPRSEAARYSQYSGRRSLLGAQPEAPAVDRPCGAVPECCARRRRGGGRRVWTSLVIAVSVLTSLDDDDLVAVGQLPPTSDQVRRWRHYPKPGLRWRRLLAHEISVLRRDCGPDFKLVVPGLRPASGEWPTEARHDPGRGGASERRFPGDRPAHHRRGRSRGGCPADQAGDRRA